MAQSNLNALFARARNFGWNPKKRESNLRQHKTDFEYAKGLIDG